MPVISALKLCYGELPSYQSHLHSQEVPPSHHVILQIDSWLALYQAIDSAHAGEKTSVDPWLIKMNHIQQSVSQFFH